MRNVCIVKQWLADIFYKEKWLICYERKCVVIYQLLELFNNSTCVTCIAVLNNIWHGCRKGKLSNRICVLCYSLWQTGNKSQTLFPLLSGHALSEHVPSSTPLIHWTVFTDGLPYTQFLLRTLISWGLYCNHPFL